MSSLHTVDLYPFSTSASAYDTKRETRVSGTAASRPLRVSESQVAYNRTLAYQETQSLNTENQNLKRENDDLFSKWIQSKNQYEEEVTRNKTLGLEKFTLGEELRKIKKENEALASQNTSLSVELAESKKFNISLQTKLNQLESVFRVAIKVGIIVFGIWSFKAILSNMYAHIAKNN